MANFFKTLFGGGPKLNLPGKEAVNPDYMSFPGAKEAYGAYKSRIGVAPEMAQRYYDYMYQPTADLARSNWSGYVEPEISSSMSARGMGRSSLVADLLRRSSQEREMKLAEYGGGLRKEGYEQGLGEERFGIGGLSDTASKAADQEARAANYQTDLADRLYNANQGRFTNQQDMLSKTIGTIGGSAMDIASGGAVSGTTGGGNWFTELLNRFKPQQRSPYVGGASGMPFESQYFGTVGV